MPDKPQEIIRPAVESDIPKLGDLFEEVFGARRDENVWRWKYFDNPRGSASFVCEAGGRIVAHCAGTPVRFRDHRSEYPALQSVDFMSSAKYAGGIGRGGVFVRTVKAFFDYHCGAGKVPLVYGFPGERHRVLGERVLGYRPVSRVGELVLEPEGGVSPDLAELSARELHRFPPIDFELGAIRDEVYLRWRYLDHPVHRYRTAVVERWWKVETIAIIGEDEENLNIMEIGGSLDPGPLSRLVKQLRGSGKRCRFWCAAEHPVGRRLMEAGFRYEPRDHFVECRFFVERENPRADELYYTIGDYDVY
ncbi:MAG: GNAT family N-acetyltransferase [Thermoanaerobaculia bacterium]